MLKMLAEIFRSRIDKKRKLDKISFQLRIFDYFLSKKYLFKVFNGHIRYVLDATIAKIHNQSDKYRRHKWKFYLKRLKFQND